MLRPRSWHKTSLIMKKIILAALCALVLLFISCTKENLQSSSNSKEGFVQARTSETIQVSVVSFSESANFFTVEFSSLENLVGVELADIQSLLISDLSGNFIATNFTVDSYESIGNNLEIVFEQGEELETELELQTGQEIIIEEGDFN